MAFFAPITAGASSLLSWASPYLVDAAPSVGTWLSTQVPKAVTWGVHRLFGDKSGGDKRVLGDKTVSNPRSLGSKSMSVPSRSSRQRALALEDWFDRNDGQDDMPNNTQVENRLALNTVPPDEIPAGNPGEYFRTFSGATARRPKAAARTPLTGFPSGQPYQNEVEQWNGDIIVDSETGLPKQELSLEDFQALQAGYSVPGLSIIRKQRQTEPAYINQEADTYPNPLWDPGWTVPRPSRRSRQPPQPTFDPGATRRIRRPRNPFGN
jgi:hypothetical protein